MDKTSQHSLDEDGWGHTPAGHWPNLKASSRWILMEKTQCSRNKTWEKGAELFLNFLQTVFTQLISSVFHRMAFFFHFRDREVHWKSVLLNFITAVKKGSGHETGFIGQTPQSWLSTSSVLPQHFTTTTELSSVYTSGTEKCWNGRGFL